MTMAPPPPPDQGRFRLSTGIGWTWEGSTYRPAPDCTHPASSRETAVTSVARWKTGRARVRAMRDRRRRAASVPCTVSTQGAPEAGERSQARRCPQRRLHRAPIRQGLRLGGGVADPAHRNAVELLLAT